MLRALHNYHFKWLMVIIHVNSTFFLGNFSLRYENFHVILISICWILWIYTAWVYVWMFIFIQHHTNDEKTIFYNVEINFFLFVPTGKVTSCILHYFVQKKPTRKLFSRLSLTPPPHNALSHNNCESKWQTCECARHSKPTFAKYIVYT